VLNTIGIRLATSNTNPGHINPDFLRVNEIVPGAWEVERPVTLEAGFSRINYNNGVSVAAAERYVLFSQRNLFNPSAELVVADLATRYLECSPTYLSIASVTVTPGCLWVPSEDLDPHSESPFSRLAIPFGDVHPRLFVRSSYQLEDKLLEVTLSDDPRAEGEGVHFFRVNGFINFRFPERGAVRDVGPAREALARLPAAVQQFYEVAAYLCTRYPDSGA
jgi:hypothetical protein